VDTLSVEVADPPEDTVTEFGLTVSCGPRGEGEAVRETVPENPSILVKLIMTLPDDPGATVSEEGLKVILKSGITTETVTVAVWVPDDAVPIIVTE
jgi:hypothetical protein